MTSKSFVQERQGLIQILYRLGTVLTMDQFAWDKKESLFYMGLLMSVGAVVACVTFVLIKPLCQR